MRTLLPLCLIAILVSSAQAGETAWQEIAPGVKLRMISTGQIKADGTTLVGLEIDMPETTKTYWRVPGETGLPTELDFSASHGVLGHEIVWPYPVRQDTPDYLDYVYLGPTILPVEVKVVPGQPTAQIEAMLGICSEICLPAQASFSLPLSDLSPDRPNGLRLRQALAKAPIAWEGDPQPIGDVWLTRDATMLAVSIGDDDLDASSLIAAIPGQDLVFGTPQKSPEPNIVLIPIMGSSGGVGLENQSVQLTFLTGMGAFSVNRKVTVAPVQ